MVGDAPRPGDPPKRVFIVSPPGPPKSYPRVRSEILRRFVLDPAAEERGYEVLGSEEIEGSGAIDRELVEHLVRDDVVIVDLTDSHPLVFYALAVRHVACKPVICLAEMGQEPLIDIPPDEIVFYDEKDMEIMKEARDELDDVMSRVEEGVAGLYPPLVGIMGIGVIFEEAGAGSRDEVLRMLGSLGAKLDEVKRALGRVSPPSTEGGERRGSRFAGLPRVELGDYEVEEVIRRLLRKASRMESLADRLNR